MAAQARRKSPAKLSGFGKSGGNLTSVAILLAGMVIGSLATILWQGAQTADPDSVGAGIRQMVEGVRQLSPAGDEKNTDQSQTRPAKPSTPFDFFTVLPEIEVVAPATETAAEVQQPGTGGAPTPAVNDDGAYMLQAASYRSPSEADRLKATLALNGLVSAIQKVSIQGRGDFYRVRLGPYPTHAAMVESERQLSRAGIKALRLKVSRGK